MSRILWRNNFCERNFCGGISERFFSFFLLVFISDGITETEFFGGEFLVEGFEYRICFFGEGRLLWRRRTTGLRTGFVRGRGNFCCFCFFGDGGLGWWSCGFLCCSGSGGW